MTSSSAVIDAPVDVVWEVLCDVDAILHWQPDLKEAECLERDAEGRPLLVHAVLETVIKRAEATLAISYEEPGVMRWEKHSGDVPGFTGSWTVTQMAPDQTEVVYQLVLDFGRFGRLVRGPLAGAIGGAVGSSMPGKLKAYVESLP